MITADFHAAGVDHGALGAGLAAGQFVTLLHAQDAFDLRQGGEGFEAGVGGFVADGRHDGLVFAADGVGGVAELGDFADDFLDLVGRGVRADDDDHRRGETTSVRGPEQRAINEIPVVTRGGVAFSRGNA